RLHLAGLQPPDHSVRIDARLLRILQHGAISPVCLLRILDGLLVLELVGQSLVAEFLDGGVVDIAVERKRMLRRPVATLRLVDLGGLVDASGGAHSSCHVVPQFLSWRYAAHRPPVQAPGQWCWQALFKTQEMFPTVFISFRTVSCRSTVIHRFIDNKSAPDVC